ncbi:MAG: guanylate kinase [Negativibacillus sp.]|nr:guanylate kinase [Negativibacillus sp.]
MNKKGQLIVVSGPSGVGKGTVLKEYLNSRDGIAYSVSATTRQPRPGEENGIHYYFLSREEFERTAAEGGMLEYASYNGNYYGTPKAPVEQQRNQGNDVVLEIEVQGALQVKKSCPDALLIFVAPPSFEELKNRLTGRQTEDAKTVENRLNIARQELMCAGEYDYIIVNDTVEQAVQRLGQIISANRYNKNNMKEFLDEVNHNA